MTDIPFSQVPLFASLKKEDREALAPICRLHSYERNDVIFHEGTPADRIYVVVHGRVKIVKAAGIRDVIIDILGDGELVGAIAVFERVPFPASALAIEPSTVLSVPERDFFAMLERRPQMTRHILAGLSLRLMTVNKRIADMTGSVERRAVRLFLTLAERAGTPREGGVFLPIALSRQEIADMIGTTLETAIRVMSRWQKDSVVLTEKNGFMIPNADALRALDMD